MNTLHPRVAEIVNELERVQQEFVTFMDSVPADRHEAPVGDGKWTVAQHVEHLAIVEDGTGRLISKLIKQVEASGEREVEASSLLDSLDRYQVWTVSRRVPAPEMVAPREGLSVAEAMDRLAIARQRMIDALKRASGLALATVAYPHPLVGPLNGYQWGLITTHHQRRHVELIQELLGTRT